MQNVRGIILMVAAMVGFALADGFIKLATTTLPNGQILIVMGLGGTIVYLAICLWRREKIISQTFFSPMILLRNVAESIGAFAFITAFALTDMSSSAAIMQVSPLLITLLAVLFLGEKVGLRRWSAITVGFFGVLLVIRPGGDSFEANSLFAVLGTVMLSVRDVATRAAPQNVSTPLMALYAFVLIIPTGIIVLLWEDPAQIPDAQTTAYLIATIFFMTLSYFAVTTSVRIAEISVVAPFRYSRIIFAMAVSLIIFKERPDTITYLGIILIVGSGIYAYVRERQAAPASHT
ncbi:MAG: DMT family transporter [Pseudoruegeria sp.]